MEELYTPCTKRETGRDNEERFKLLLSNVIFQKSQIILTRTFPPLLTFHFFFLISPFTPSAYHVIQSLFLLYSRAEKMRSSALRGKEKLCKKRKYPKLYIRCLKRSLFAVDIHNLLRYYMRCHLARLLRTVWIKWLLRSCIKGLQRVENPFKGYSNFELKIQRTKLM